MAEHNGVEILAIERLSKLSEGSGANNFLLL